MSRRSASSGPSGSSAAVAAAAAPAPPTQRASLAAGTATSGAASATSATAAASAVGRTSSAVNVSQLPQDISHLLGTPITLKLASGSTAYGLLWAHDVHLGVVVLETGAVTPSPMPDNAVCSPAPYRTSGARASATVKEHRTGFRIVKVRDIKGVSTSEIPVGSETVSKVSDIYPINVAAAEAREAAAVRDGMTRASRKGKGVTSLAQDVFDALSKTLPCRWHDKHIIVMDEIVISGPAYDASSANIPGLPAERLRALLESSGNALESASVSEKAKVNSYSRVVKVLEGERKKILARQALSVPASSSPAPSSDSEVKGG